ncbi:MAG: hypothetical protein ABIA04_15540 [Pseudomonadota bacterium]
MKKLVFLIFLAIFFVLFSCSQSTNSGKDADDEENVSKNPIISGTIDISSIIPRQDILSRNNCTEVKKFKKKRKKRESSTEVK